MEVHFSRLYFVARGIIGIIDYFLQAQSTDVDA
jgi:hypothetical protein